MQYDASTTVMEAVEQLASQIKLENYQTFSLFMVHKVRLGDLHRLLASSIGSSGLLCASSKSHAGSQSALSCVCCSCRARPATRSACRPPMSMCCATTTASLPTSCEQVGLRLTGAWAGC